MAVTADIKVFPGKELKAVDMAEVLDACSIANGGIIQGCAITYNQQAQTLSMGSGYILIKGRLAAITGGTIDEYPTLSAESDCRLLAVCDLTSVTPFYIRLFSSAEYDSISARAAAASDFNVENGVAFVVLGVAKVNPATNKVTAWTPHATGSIPRKDADTFLELSNTVSNNDTSVRQLITQQINTVNANANASHNLLTQKINAWATYLQKRTSSADRFSVVQFTVPSFTIGAGARVGCTFPAIRGTTFRATGTNARTETRPSWATFTQTYTKLSDGTQIPLNVDNAEVRYFAVGISQILMSNAAYQSKGKNATNCVVAGWALYGADYDRRGSVYVRNVGTAEAIIDLTITLTFVRRG